MHKWPFYEKLFSIAHGFKVYFGLRHYIFRRKSVRVQRLFMKFYWALTLPEEEENELKAVFKIRLTYMFMRF